MRWITWPFQDEAIPVIKKWFGVKDVGCEKSRDQGATWMFLVDVQHEFQFGSDSKWMLVSRNEKLVDTKGDPDSLFWKLDFLRETQPPFLLPPPGAIERFELKLRNLRDNVVVTGASTTGDAGAGGRCTGIFIDEFGRFEKRESYAINAATVPNTNSRAMCSTYQGADGAFYDQMQRADEDFVKISLPWTLHPEKMKGAEKDPTNRLGWTSPWYRKECKRLQVPGKIAQELDMDPQGSASPLFRSDLLERCLEEARPPVWRGVVVYDAFNLKQARLVEDPKGDVLLWWPVKPDGKIVVGEKFAAGSDISQGTGATPSVLSGASLRTREKVLEVERRDLSPDRWAELVVALCWLFNEMYLMWENNGPGSAFGKRVIDLHYRNIYIRKREDDLFGGYGERYVPGWNSGKTSKLDLLAEYARCLADQSFVNRSARAIRECKEYHYLPGGKVAHAKSVGGIDLSAQGEFHGDHVIADALCCKALGKDQDPEALNEKMPDEADPYTIVPNAPPHSFHWLMNQWRNEQQRKSDWESSPESLRGWDDSPESLQGW